MRPKKESTQRQQRLLAVEFVLRDFFLLMKFEYFDFALLQPLFYYSQLVCFQGPPEARLLQFTTRFVPGATRRSRRRLVRTLSDVDFFYIPGREQTPDLPGRVSGGSTGIRVGSKEICWRGRRMV